MTTVFSGNVIGVNSEALSSGGGFTGPTLVSASSVGPNGVRLTFDHEMLMDLEEPHTPGTLDVASYTIRKLSDSSPLWIVAVVWIDDTHVDLVTDDQVVADYEVKALAGGAQDRWGNFITEQTASFTGTARSGYQTPTTLRSFMSTLQGMQEEAETDIYPDVTLPYLHFSDPTPGEGNVPINKTVVLEFRDDGDGLDATDLTITIGGELAWALDGPQPGWSGTKQVPTPPGPPFALRYNLTRDTSWAEGVPISVAYSVPDLAVPPNTLVDSWSFTTALAAPYLQNLNPSAGEPDVAPDTAIQLEIIDVGTGVNEDSVVLKVMGITCWEHDAETGPFSVAKLAVTNGFRYTINPFGLLPSSETITIAVYAEDNSATPAVLDTSYVFYTSEGEVLVRVPMGAVYVDKVELPELADPDVPDPLVCCRMPPPPVPAGLETAEHPFVIDEGSSFSVEMGPVPVRSVTGTTLDRLTKASRIAHLENGAFTSADVGRLLRVPASDGGTNNLEYTIEAVLGPKDVILGQEPRVDEGPRDFMGDMGSVLDSTQTTQITFPSGTFPDPLQVLAPQLAAYINGLGLDYLTASMTIDGRRVRLTPVDIPSGPPLGRAVADSIRIISDSANLGFPTATQSTSYMDVDKDADVAFDVICKATDPVWGDLRVWLFLNGVEELIFHADAGSTVFIASGWSVAQSIDSSPGAPNPDVWHVALSHAESFYSENRIRVRIEAQREAGTYSTTATHEFLVEDWLQPHVEDIIPWAPKKLRLEFSEDMLQDAADPVSALYVRDVSGRVAYHRSYTVGLTTWYNVIEAPVADFVDEEEGMFLGSRGAKNALNNGSFEILECLSDSLVRVDATLVDEAPADPARETPPTLAVSPYRVKGVPPAAPEIMPIFEPIVRSAEVVDSLIIPPYESAKRFVMLTLDDDLTPFANYELEVVKIQDEAGNEITSTYPFVSWQPNWPPGREWDLWEMLPLMNRDADTSQDLERIVKCFNEVAAVMLADVDRFGSILDPIATPDSVVDVLLQHLGNALAFVDGLTTQKKRDLVPLLVPMYKRRGTAVGIEDAVEFFTTKTVQITPWEIPTNIWKIGRSWLGRNTYIGPSRSFVRYSFYVDHSASLTDSEKDVIAQIVDFMRPAHTHFIGFRLVTP